MYSKDIYSFVGLMARARQLSSGSQLIEHIRKRLVYFVIICEDASDNTKKKIIDKCNYYHIDYCIALYSDDLSLAIGKDNRVAIGIMDKGFADKIKSKLGG